MPIPEIIEKNIVANASTYTNCDLSSCGLDDTHLDRLLILLSQNTHIRSLNLYRNNISNAGAEKLVKHLSPSITILNFGYNRINDEGIEPLLNSLKPSVKELNLTMNSSITDKGAEIAFKCNKNVKINVYHTQIKSEYAHLLFAGPNKKVQHPVIENPTLSQANSISTFSGIYSKVSQQQSPANSILAAHQKKPSLLL